jgi:hypothetical protein
MESQTAVWAREAKRLHAIHCQGCNEQPHCQHDNAEPYDEGACFGWCLDCGTENIPNSFAGHYPCTHPMPAGSR